MILSNFVNYFIHIYFIKKFQNHLFIKTILLN
jgi:hypothetical protein